VSFKIFTKLLMTRLNTVADKIISSSQTAFIKGRYIVDGAVMLHEIVHELQTKKQRGVIFKIDFEKAYDSVSWDFVEDVLKKKGFEERLRSWITQTVRGGQSVYNINGENGPYFKTHQGLRQEDPLSPLLFNLAVDALAHILTKAREQGYVRGVVPHLIPGGITHLQYADDTVIMTDGGFDTIRNLKFLLYCFEWMSGLKINYHKSELITFGMDSEEQHAIANMLNCKMGEMPMRYLGFPISSRNVGVGGFKSIIEKMRKSYNPGRVNIFHRVGDWF